MWVGHCLLLSCALWLLAEQLTEAHEVQLRTEDDEAQKCPEFRSCMKKWETNRLALREHTDMLYGMLDMLFDDKGYPNNIHKVVTRGVLSALVLGGLFHPYAFAHICSGLFCYIAADYGVKSYLERDLRELIPRVRYMAEEDMRLQKTMLDLPCDEPPFVGLDKTAESLIAGLEQASPPSWFDYSRIAADKTSENEPSQGSKWLLPIIEKLQKKLEYPIDDHVPTTTVILSAEQVAAIHSKHGVASKLLIFNR